MFSRTKSRYLLLISVNKLLICLKLVKKGVLLWFIWDCYLCYMEMNIALLLNLPKVKVWDFSISEKETHVCCESTNAERLCPVCQKPTFEVIMYQKRTIRDMALLGRKVYSHLKTRQFHCKWVLRWNWFFVNFGERLIFSLVLKNGTITISPSWAGFHSF